MAGQTNAEAMVELGGSKDMTSFLVPCYGFETPEQANEYAAGPWGKECRIFSPEDAYAPILRGRWSYVARMSARYGKWLTDALVGREARLRDNKPIWEALRGKDTAKPVGAYHVALLVEGRRQFFRHHHQTTKHPKWWYRISDGHRDCYAVWSRRDGAEIGGAMVIGNPRFTGASRIYAARAGRGVIYSREALFDNHGQPCGFCTELVRVEFSILDRDPAKDDMLRVSVVSATCFPGSEDEAPEDRLDGRDESWRPLIQQARNGFEMSCSTVPEDVEAWRKFFLDQRAKAEADRRQFGDSFRERVEQMDWQDALRLVEEPWQLQAVINAHTGRPEFYDSPGYPGATYSKVRNMLTKHDCTEARRDALWKMVAAFVEPCDNLWDYTGD